MRTGVEGKLVVVHRFYWLCAQQCRSLETRTDGAVIRAIAVLLLLVTAAAQAQIHRSAAEVLAFKRQNPCPATGLRRGACPGWEVDHTVPLCAGGMDKRENMVWLTTEDHAFKTRIDVRECRKLARMANRPAQ